jgi:phenylpropionate dioxygenase-like ring-hydroxylating dioxygenase large terminal subunit
VAADPNVDEMIAQIIESDAGPFERALTSPPAAYRSEALYELEIERILGREWNIVGRAGELPNPGDYFTYTVAEEGIIVLRNREGEVRAFPNVCLHRVSRSMTGEVRQKVL